MVNKKNEMRKYKSNAPQLKHSQTDQKTNNPPIDWVPVKCETKWKRNETERNEIKQNETKPNETKRNVTSFRFV